MEPKRVKDSQMVMAFHVLPEDANPAGSIQGGVVMKRIDETATVVAMRHARNLAVTASMDRLDFYNPVRVGDLLILSASVNMVGRTSMELGVRVEAENLVTGEKRHTASAYLTLVALDKNMRPTGVPELILENDMERRRHQEALDRRAVRLAEKAREQQARE